MIKTVVVSLLVGFLSFAAVFVQGDEPGGLPMPTDFDGVYPGMSVGELLEIRPSATVPVMDQHSRAQLVDTTDPNQSLQEYVPVDSAFGLSMIAAYTFLEGGLKHMLLIWTGPMTQIREHRRGFISQSLNIWGQEYESRVTELEPGTPHQHLAPLLVWSRENAVVAVVCTSENPDKQLEAGTFMINVFAQDYDPAANALIGKDVDADIRDGLFQGIGISPEDESVKSED